MQRWTDRGAAIIAQGDKIILMRRERGFGKNKQIYYTIPGGGREEGEKIEETAIREIKEELGIDIKIKKLMYKLNTYMRMQYIFLGEYVSGILGTGEGEEYEEENYKKYGKYIPQVVSFEKLKKIKLVPETLKKEIIRDYLYIIGKSKKRIQNRKYLRKEETSNINNRKNASNKALISNKKRDFLKNDITIDEKNKLKRVIKKQESYKEKIEKLNKETKDKSIRNTNNKRKNNYISKSKNNNKIKDENKNKNEKREFVEKRKFKNRENIKKRNNKIKKKNVTKK